MSVAEVAVSMPISRNPYMKLTRNSSAKWHYNRHHCHSVPGPPFGTFLGHVGDQRIKCFIQGIFIPVIAGGGRDGWLGAR
jgi:hypothetical protein